MGNKESLKIRDFRRSDLEKMLDCRQELAGISFPGLDMDRENERKEILGQVKRHPGTVKVAELGRKPVGFVRFRPGKGPFGEYGHIYMIFVDMGCRKKGVGTALLQAAEDWFRAKGIRRMQASITNTNQASLGFFGSHGYLEKRTLVEKRL